VSRASAKIWVHGCPARITAGGLLDGTAAGPVGGGTVGEGARIGEAVSVAGALSVVAGAVAVVSPGDEGGVDGGGWAGRATSGSPVLSVVDTAPPVRELVPFRVVLVVLAGAEEGAGTGGGAIAAGGAAS
jgi:hypothetical protein